MAATRRISPRTRSQRLPPHPHPAVASQGRRLSQAFLFPRHLPPRPPISPLPPSIAKEATTKFTSVYTLACALLRPQAHDETPLVGHEQERTYILNFLTPFLAGKSHANHEPVPIWSTQHRQDHTCQQVLKSVSVPSSHDLPDMEAAVRVVYMNCMALVVKDVMTGVWERCAEELNVPKHRKRGAAINTDWSKHFCHLLFVASDPTFI